MLYIFLSLLLYSSGIMFSTLASRLIDSNLVSGIATVFAVIPMIAIVPFLSRKTIGHWSIGIVYAILCGLLIGLFTLAINKSYTVNKVAIVVPIVFGGSIFLTAILSFVFLREKITPIQGFGLLFLGIGILLIIYAKATGN